PIPVLVPRRDDGGHRDRAWDWLKKNFWATLEGYQVIEGYHDEGLFNRAAGVNVAAKVAGNWDVAVIADADAWVDPAQLDKAVRQARQTGKLVSALNEVWMLSEQQTATIMRSTSVPTRVSRPPERKTDPTMT